jgi:hypothetical protein
MIISLFVPVQLENAQVLNGPNSYGKPLWSSVDMMTYSGYTFLDNGLSCRPRTGRARMSEGKKRKLYSAKFKAKVGLEAVHDA